VDFSFSEEQEAVRELAEQVFTGSSPVERVKEVEAADERFDRALWAELATTGLLGIGLPEAHGGAGLGLVEVCLALRAQGRRIAHVPYWPTVVAAQTIAAHGDADQQAAWLGRVVAGEAVLTLALEPADGAVAGGVLSGEWPCVPSLNVADAVLVPAGGVLHLVEVGAEGVSFEVAETTSRGQVGHLRLDGVPATAVGGPEALTFAHERALVSLAAVTLGACEEATRMAAEYTSNREQFGKALSTNQAVALKAADAYIAISAMDATLWQAAWRIDEGLDATDAVEVAHWWACDGGHRVVHITQHLHGGMGADIDYPVHRYFLWAKHLEFALGSGTEQLARIGSRLAAVPVD
jgi:acyl-CoA dehydrogenase